MALNQSERQQSCRTVTGATSGTYNENWLELIDFYGLGTQHAAEGNTTFNGRMKDYCERVMGRRYALYSETLTAFARYVTAGAAVRWDDLGIWDPTKYPVAKILHDFTLSPYLPTSISFSRAGPAWDYQLREYGANVPRVVLPSEGVRRGLGWLIEESRTNKCENFNVGQGGTANMTPFGGATIEAIPLAGVPVDVLNAFLAKGFDTGTVKGLFRLAGGAASGVDPAGAAGNTNNHALSVYAYVSSGSGTLQFSDGLGPVALNTGFERTINVRSAFTGVERLQISLTAAGSEVWFLANVMEEGDFATSPIVTSGAAQTRNADEATEPVYSGWSGAELTALTSVDVSSSLIDDGTRPLYVIGDGTSANRISVRATKPGGTDQLSLVTVAGGATGVNAAGGTVANAWNAPAAVALGLSNGATPDAAVNGTSVTLTGTYASVSGATTIFYGRSPTLNSWINGYVRTFALYDRQLNPLPSGFDAGFDNGF